MGNGGTSPPEFGVGDFVMLQNFKHQITCRLLCRKMCFFASTAGLLYRVPTVRESQGILRESGKVRENREGQGKVREFLKYSSLDQLFMH